MNLKPNSIFIVVMLIVGIAVGYGIGYGTVSTGETTNLKEQVLDLQTDLNERNNNISALESEMSDLTSQILDFQTDVSDKELQIQSLHSKIMGIESQFLELENFVSPPANMAPDFTLQDLDGNSFMLSDFRGEIVIIDFMATWCGSCEQEIPHLETIWDENQVVIISIDADPSHDTEEKLRDFKDNYDAPWIWAMDTVDVSGMYKVRVIPTMVIVDQNGYIWTKYVGLTNSETINLEIEQLLSYWGSPILAIEPVTISAVEAKQLIDTTPNLAILDVRTVEEFNGEHLNDAVNIPVQELLERLGELNKSSEILVYCRSGVRSAQASQILVDNGFTEVYNMDGGITAWTDKGFPIIILPK